jgi:hypothetical protein
VTTVVLVWLVVGLLSTAMVLAVVIALVRHVVLLGRAVSRFNDEVAPIAREIGQGTERASRRSASLAPPRSARRT